MPQRLQGRLSWLLPTFCLAISCSVLLLACEEAARSRRHDVVLIVIDTLRADHLGCYGYPRNTSANIDHLAREAIVYKNVSSRELIEAQDNLEDYGQYAVPHLIDILRSTGDGKIRYAAVRILILNAPRRVISRSSGALTEAEKELNREIDQEKVRMRQWAYRFSDPEEKKLAVADEWIGWYEKHQGRYTYTFGDKVRIFFTDTRFAKYWANLFKLDFLDRQNRC